MRIMIIFQPLSNFNYFNINKHMIQGFIYKLLKDTRFSYYHDIKGFKFFNFSNIFPITDFDKNHTKKLIISSPNSKFIKTVYYSLKSKDEFNLGKNRMFIKDLKVFDLMQNNKFISSTPLVLYEDNKANLYFSFRKNNDFDFFFNRLKDNSIKKYNSFYDDDFSMNDILFDSFELQKEVSVRLNKNNVDFIIIGSLWRYLEKKDVENNKFYKFLLDCGLGEKNSLGFGMVNNVRE